MQFGRSIELQHVLLVLHVHGPSLGDHAAPWGEVSRAPVRWWCDLDMNMELALKASGRKQERHFACAHAIITPD